MLCNVSIKISPYLNIIKPLIITGTAILNFASQIIYPRFTNITMLIHWQNALTATQSLTSVYTKQFYLNKTYIPSKCSRNVHLMNRLKGKGCVGTFAVANCRDEFPPRKTEVYLTNVSVNIRISCSYRY